MAPFRTFFRKSRSLGRMDPVRRRMLIEAALWLTVARIATWFVPFRKIAARIGEPFAPGKGDAKFAAAANPAGAVAIANHVGWTVHRMAEIVPFEAVCLQRALAAQWMLRRRGVTGMLHFGVTVRAAEPMKAHAWLDAAGVQVTGYPFDDDYKEVACFV